MDTFFTHTTEGSAMRKASHLFSDEVLANRLGRLCDHLDHSCADDMRGRWDTVEHDGYTHGELRLAFDMCASPSDWRGPIDAIVDARFSDLASSAIAFYTATVPTTRKLAAREKLARRSPVENPVRVRSPGYRDGPAGP